MESEQWKPKDWSDEQLQNQLNILGDQAEALIVEKTKNGVFWFTCNDPPLVLTIRPGNEFEYKKTDKYYDHEIKHIPGKCYDISIFHLNGWSYQERIQKAQGFGWHLLTLQTVAFSAGSIGSEHNEFRFDAVKNFKRLIGYIDKGKQLQI